MIALPEQPFGEYLQTEQHFRVPAVTASFKLADEAQRAAEALERAGFRHVQVDRLHARPARRGDLDAQPFPTSLTGHPGKDEADQRVLAAADPSISGWSAPGLVGGNAYLLTVVVDDPERRERALEIIRRHGGQVGIHRDVDRE